MTRIETPDSPDSEYVVLFADGSGRLRKKQVRYPAGFLKEDPRTLGVFLYDEAGRMRRAIRASTSGESPFMNSARRRRDWRARGRRARAR
jgi:hypothetical protein